MSPAPARNRGTQCCWTRDHLRVALRNFVTDMPLRLRPWEQYPERPTRLVINVDLYLAVESGPLPEKDITNV